MRFRIGLALLFLALVANPAQADLFYYTGVDANKDGIDDNFKVNGQSAYLVTHIADGWPALPNSGITDGLYISWAADQSNETQGGVPGGLWTYTFKFNWEGAGTDTTFDFRWLSDDYLSDIMLNGASLGVNNLSQPSPWTTSYARPGVSGTVASGLNTIEFLVWNTAGNPPGYPGVSGPTGFAGDFRVHGQATPVPEPGTLLLLGSGVVGLVASRRRRAR